MSLYETCFAPQRKTSARSTRLSNERISFESSISRRGRVRPYGRMVYAIIETGMPSPQTRIWSTVTPNTAVSTTRLSTVGMAAPRCHL